MAYNSSARFYDLLYREKDYAAEVESLRSLVNESAPTARTLLDVACGTGKHLAHLREAYACVGLDLSPELLAIARERLPGVPLHEGDMRTFDFSRTFGVVTCLFSAIGYMTNVYHLQQAIANMARHVAPGGVLLIEPWFAPDQIRNGYLGVIMIDEPHVKITRMNRTEVTADNRSILPMHHLIGTPDEAVQHFLEVHEMGLFTPQQYMDAVSAAGLQPTWDEEGLTGRGLLIGVRA